jgi:hypothetical protein
MVRCTGLRVVLGVWVALSTPRVPAQDAPATNEGTVATPPKQGRAAGDFADGPRPLFGKITALHDGSMEITKPDGGLVVVKLTNQTVYRKDRANAKIADFKIGDAVMVRGDENPDHSVTARLVGGRGAQGGAGMMWSSLGTLGRDYVAGEVKAIDPPKLTVLRTDGVTQTLELNESSSLRRGRESITMADIQVGDHLMARGALEKDVFVPKGVMVINAEQWKQMQEMGAQFNGPKTAGSDAAAPKPQEQPH